MTEQLSKVYRCGRYSDDAPITITWQSLLKDTQISLRGAVLLTLCRGQLLRKLLGVWKI